MSLIPIPPTLNPPLDGHAQPTFFLDLASTHDLLAALERRFDTLVFAGTILLSDGPQGKQEQRVVRRKGHDLIQAGLVQLLAMHCQPRELEEDRGEPIGGPE